MVFSVACGCPCLGIRSRNEEKIVEEETGKRGRTRDMRIRCGSCDVLRPGPAVCPIGVMQFHGRRCSQKKPPVFRGVGSTPGGGPSWFRAGWGTKVERVYYRPE